MPSCIITCLVLAQEKGNNRIGFFYRIGINSKQSIFILNSTTVRTMDKRHLRERPRKVGPSETARPAPLIIPQWCTHQTGMKYVQANTCPCQATNYTCMNGWPSENCLNRGPTWTPVTGGRPWAPTALRLMTNLNQNIKEVHKAAPILWQATALVAFHLEEP